MRVRQSLFSARSGVDADSDGNIFECRQRGFEAWEKQENFLSNPAIEGSYGERWSLRKVLCRFIWHDRIHAKAMYKMAVGIWGYQKAFDVFKFGEINNVCNRLKITKEG